MPLLWAGLYARWQFQDMIASRAVQVVQPDLIQAGGIWESRKIAAMPESRDTTPLADWASLTATRASPDICPFLLKW